MNIKHPSGAEAVPAVAKRRRHHAQSAVESGRSARAQVGLDEDDCEAATAMATTSDDELDTALLWQAQVRERQSCVVVLLSIFW